MDLAVTKDDLSTNQLTFRYLKTFCLLIQEVNLAQGVYNTRAHSKQVKCKFSSSF